MFATKSKLRHPANLLIINLALADGTFLMCYPAIINNMLVHRGRQGYGHVACMAQSFLTVGSAHTSLFTMGLIAISRYIAIVHPQRKATWLTWKTCGFACCYAWAHPILIMVPAVAGWGRLGWYAGGWLCAFDWTYNIVYNFLVFFLSQGITSMVMFVCYIQIYLEYRRSKKRVAGKDTGQKGLKKQDIRLAVQLIVIFAIYNTCWIPFFITSTFIYPASDGPPWLFGLFQIFIAFNSAVNILVYLYFNQTFREECLKSFCFKSSSEQSSQGTASTSVDTK